MSNTKWNQKMAKRLEREDGGVPLTDGSSAPGYQVKQPVIIINVPSLGVEDNAGADQRLRAGLKILGRRGR